MRIIILLVLGLGLTLLLTTCSESPTDPGTAATLSGSVLAYVCTPNDAANDTLNLYYSQQTGRPAYVEMTRLDDGSARTVTALTDMRSHFRIHAGEGQWQVAILSAHSYRQVVDTLDLTADTSIDYTIRYRFRDPDTIDVRFTYVLSGPGNLYDPESPTEMEYIERLNDSTGGLMVPDDARFSVDSFPQQNELYHVYAVPLKEQTPPNWALTTNLPYWIYRWGSRLPSSAFPENMLVSVRTFPLCPEDIVIIIDSTFMDSFWPPPPGPAADCWGDNSGGK